MGSYSDALKWTLDRHELRKVCDNDFAECWELYIPGSGWMETARITFFKEPQQILVSGDLCPSRHGVVSDYRYGFGWFAGRLSEHYLCEKFLSKIWVAERCRESLTEELEQFRRDLEQGETDERIEGLVELLEEDFDELGEHGVRERLDDLCSSFCDDGMPGYDYPPRDAGLLCKIQQRFSELAAALKATEAATV